MKTPPTDKAAGEIVTIVDGQPTRRPIRMGDDIDDAGLSDDEIRALVVNPKEEADVEDTRHPAILGLDLGTTTGWCVLCSDRLASGTWDLSGNRWEGGGMRFVRFSGCLADLATRVRIALVAYEEVVRHKGANASQIYGGFVAHLAAWCERSRPPIPYVGLTVSAIKVFATGNAKAGKDAMVKSCNLRWPTQAPDGKGPGYVIDDNEADARWIAALADDTWDMFDDGDDDGDGARNDS